MKLTPRRVLVYIIALYTLISLLASCTKTDYSCGVVVGGNTEFNRTVQQWYFYLKVEYPDVIINERVDQKTYESFYIGDEICW